MEKYSKRKFNIDNSMATSKRFEKNNVVSNERNWEKVVMRNTKKTVRAQTLGKAQTRKLYFDEMKPMFIMLRLMGRFPYGFTRTGFAPFCVNSWPFLYCCFFHIFFCSLTTWSIKTMIRDGIYKAKTYDETLFWTLLIIFSLQSFTAPLTFGFDAPNTVYYFQKWIEFEEFWIGEQMITTVIWWLAVICSTVAVPFAIFYLFIEAILFNEMSLIAYIHYLPIIISSVTMLTFWCLTLFKLKKYCNKLLEDIFKERNRKQIGMRRRVWMKLSRLASGIGQAIGVSALCYLITTFVSFVLALYGLFVNLMITIEGNTFFWGLLVGAVYCVVYNFIASEAAHQAFEQIGSNFSQSLLQIDISYLPKICLHEIELLVKCIECQSPIIGYKGFIILNRHTFGLFMYGSVTYLIVLLQFKKEPNNQGEYLTVKDIGSSNMSINITI